MWPTNPQSHWIDLFSACIAFLSLALRFDLCSQKTCMSWRPICSWTVSWCELDLGCCRFLYLLHQYRSERISIRVLSSNLNHPVRGYVCFAQNYSPTLILLDHLLGVLDVAILKVFEMVFSVDDRAINCITSSCRVEKRADICLEKPYPRAHYRTLASRKLLYLSI